MTATLLPNAKQTFLDGNGKPLAGGQVFFYIPNTSTLKSTWQDPAQTILNTNPVILDASGEAVIWGSGTYRQVVYDVNGNLIWDQITEDANSGLTGNMTDDIFVAGTDFTPGTTTQLTLSVGAGSLTNTWIFFDGVYQADPSIASLNGVTLTFTDVIPIGTTIVTVKIGNTIALGTVTDANVQSGSKLYNRITDFYDVRDFGAVGNGVVDDKAAFTVGVTPLLVTPCPSAYLIKSDTTIASDLIFMGGVITVPSGVTLTINGDIEASSRVIFKGDGTVIVNKGIIDVAWFDGADASAKTAFCLRGVQNTNGTGKTLAYYPPSPGDAWAVQSANLQWGFGWAVAAPIALEQAQNYTVYMTYSSFIATAAMDSIFTLGKAGVGSSSVLKADGQIFPLRLKTDGGNGLANWAVRIYGSSHSYFPHCEFYYSGGMYISPAGAMQVSDITIGFVDTGALFNQAILMEGAAGATNTVSDIDIGFVNSTGFSNGHAAPSVVQIGSNCNSINVRKVCHRAAVSGIGGMFQDATTGVVLVTNSGASGPNAISCRYGITIGPVINGSLIQTAECVVVADASSGTAALMTGITIEAGSQNDTGSPPGGATISLAYTSGVILQGLPGPSAANGVGQKVTVNPTCQDTRIYGVLKSNVTDVGVNTLIDGHNYGPITAVAAVGSGNPFTNTNHFHVLYQITGATAISVVAYTRGASTINIAAGVGGTGAWLLAPGDSISISYTGSPNFSVVPM